jgi:hypothetical protein
MQEVGMSAEQPGRAVHGNRLKVAGMTPRSKTVASSDSFIGDPQRKGHRILSRRELNAPSVSQRLSLGPGGLETQPKHTLRAADEHPRFEVL